MPEMLEIRDPVHVFVRVYRDERQWLVDSEPLQRLRDVHQLAMTYLLYPGASHKRFEHSLGVLELATKIFDRVSDPQRIAHLPENNPVIEELKRRRDRWRQVLRAAALCHDIGHMPFSHAAESLLPEGWNHETVTRDFILSDSMAEIWGHLKVEPAEVVKVALGQKGHDFILEPIEHFLTEIITGDAFGADRMDYLLRDSLHTGVAYGRFDHHRLIDTLRLMPAPPADDSKEAEEDDIQLGVEAGGLNSAEALMLARYFIFSQVYFHPLRKIYDIHLRDFLKHWLPSGVYPADLDTHLATTDATLLEEIRRAAKDGTHPAHLSAACIFYRQHYKRLYQPSQRDLEVNPDAGRAVLDALRKEFGPEMVRRADQTKGSGNPDFPVSHDKGRSKSAWASSLSQVLNAIPPVSIDCVFVHREMEKKARKYLDDHHHTIIEQGL
jgi:hypothetical protein